MLATSKRETFMLQFCWRAMCYILTSGIRVTQDSAKTFEPSHSMHCALDLDLVFGNEKISSRK